MNVTIVLASVQYSSDFQNASYYELHISQTVPDMTPLKNFQKGVWPGSCNTINFWSQNINSSKTVKATDFTFDMRVLRDRTNITH